MISINLKKTINMFSVKAFKKCSNSLTVYKVLILQHIYCKPYYLFCSDTMISTKVQSYFISPLWFHLIHNWVCDSSFHFHVCNEKRLNAAQKITGHTQNNRAVVNLGEKKHSCNAASLYTNSTHCHSYILPTYTLNLCLHLSNCWVKNTSIVWFVYLLVLNYTCIF